LLFVILLLFILLVPVLAQLRMALYPEAPPVLEASIFILLLAGTVVSVSSTRAGKLVSICVAVPAGLLTVFHHMFGLNIVGVARHVLGIAFLSYTIAVLLRFIFTRQRVTTNVVCASLCIYLLLGIVWALAYSTTFLFDEGAFKSTVAGVGPLTVFHMGSGGAMPVLYFSFCTLTTLGYGDIVPISPMARALAAVEALTGQLYLAVLVSRLVGLHIAQSLEEQPPKT
jgi:hypothetical protein